jgi:hypothetical protein
MQLRSPTSLCYHWARASMKQIAEQEESLKNLLSIANRALLRMLNINADVSYKENMHSNMLDTYFDLEYIIQPENQPSHIRILHVDSDICAAFNRFNMLLSTKAREAALEYLTKLMSLARPIARRGMALRGSNGEKTQQIVGTNQQNAT